MRTRHDRSWWHRCRAACLVVAAGLIAFDADSLRARGVLDVNDPAFAGSVVVTLPVAVVPAGATSFQFTSNGVTFLFESLDGVSSLSATNGVPVVPRFQTGFRGVRLTITPPVAAIGSSERSSTAFRKVRSSARWRPRTCVPLCARTSRPTVHRRG